MKQRIELRPVPLWAWLAGGTILLLLPLLFTYRQAMNRFETGLREEERSLQKQLQQTLARLNDEMATPFQVERLAREFMKRSRRLVLDASYREKALRALHRELPGVQVLWFDDRFELDRAKSDPVPMLSPFKALIEGILLRKEDPPDSEAFRQREAALYTRLKWFGDAPLMNAIFRTERRAFAVSQGKSGKSWLLWSFLENSPEERGDDRILGGIILLIPDRLVPSDLAPRAFHRRNHRRLAKRGIQIGWLDARNMKRAHFPRSLPKYKRASLLRALLKGTDTRFDDPSLSLIGSIFHHESRVILYALGSTRGITERFEKNGSRLRLSLLLLALIPLLTVIIFRINGGISLGIRLQVIGLFLFAVGTPTLATIQLGLDLLRDHRIAIERDALQMMEGVSESLANSIPLAYSLLEKNADGMIESTRKLAPDVPSLDEAGKNRLGQAIAGLFEPSGVTHFFIADDDGRILFQRSSSPMRESEGRDFQPLFGALARLKLKTAGKEGSGKNDLLDQMLESTIGNIQEVKGLLEQGDRPFNLQAMGKTLYVYTRLHPAPDPDRTLVYLFVANDNQFERQFLEFLVTRVLSKLDALAEGVEVYAVSNDATFDEGLIPATGRLSRYNRPEDQPFRKKLISTAIPTLRNGFTVTSEIGNGKRKWLFLSQRSRHLNRFSLVFLYDQARIDRKVAALVRQTSAYVCLYFFITLILGFGLSRGLLEPIARLRQGVEAIQKQEYQTTIALPGRDELVELGTAFNEMARGLWERMQMTTMLSRSAVASVKGETGARLGGERIRGSVLVVGIQGFATFVESQTPEAVVQFLNEYVSLMHETVARFQGDIDKFMGDTIMVVFPLRDDPSAGREDALQVARCAIAMNQGIEAFNRRRKTAGARNALPVSIEIGIAAGDLVAGNIGSVARKDHTVVGEAVILAGSLEKESIRGRHTRIIINRLLADLLGHAAEVEKLKTDVIRGMTRPVEMFELVRLAG